MPSSNKVRKVTSENYPTDSGREGELIFRLVYQQAGCKKPFTRLWLSSMEENAIREGFAHLKPSTEYDALYNAALCRERADWMVGIRNKMESSGILSIGSYLRKMALDGYCLHLDLPQLRRMAYLLQMCSNNLNQYAKVAKNGRVYAADLEDLRARLDELIDIGRQILSRLAEL